MVLRDVQQLEVVVVVFDFGALDRLEAHAGEDVEQVIEDDVHRVERAGRALDARQRDVQRLGGQAGFLFEGTQLFGALVQRGLQTGAGLVDDLAHLRALLGGQLAHAAQNAGQFALLAQHAHAQLFQGGGILDLLELLHHAFADGFQLILHVGVLLSEVWGTHRKAPPSKGEAVLAVPPKIRSGRKRPKPLTR